MHDVIALVSPDEIHGFFMALWRTPEFRESHVPGGYVFRWVDRLAEYPRFIGELTDPHIERAHFSPWWNILGRRNYDVFDRLLQLFIIGGTVNRLKTSMRQPHLLEMSAPVRFPSRSLPMARPWETPRCRDLAPR